MVVTIEEAVAGRMAEIDRKEGVRFRRCWRWRNLSSTANNVFLRRGDCGVLSAKEQYLPRRAMAMHCDKKMALARLRSSPSSSPFNFEC